MSENDLESIGFGGERGIRTLDTVSRIHAFQACAFNHSATSPSRARRRLARRAWCAGRRGLQPPARRRNIAADPVLASCILPCRGCCRVPQVGTAVAKPFKCPRTVPRNQLTTTSGLPRGHKAVANACVDGLASHRSKCRVAVANHMSDPMVRAVAGSAIADAALGAAMGEGGMAHAECPPPEPARTPIRPDFAPTRCVPVPFRVHAIHGSVPTRPLGSALAPLTPDPLIPDPLNGARAARPVAAPPCPASRT